MSSCGKMQILIFKIEVGTTILDIIQENKKSEKIVDYLRDFLDHH